MQFAKTLFTHQMALIFPPRASDSQPERKKWSIFDDHALESWVK